MTGYMNTQLKMHALYYFFWLKFPITQAQSKHFSGNENYILF
jgi:hypothetical protein